LGQNNVFGKSPDGQRLITVREDMLKSGMSYQEVLDAEATQDASLKAQAAARAPNDPAAQQQIFMELKHEQLVQYLWDHDPPEQHYKLLLDVITQEAHGTLTQLQIETEAVRRMAMMNGGMSYLQVMAAVEAERQELLDRMLALAAAMMAKRNGRDISSTQSDPQLPIATQPVVLPGSTSVSRTVICN
jgi:hypothetical protein